MLYICLLAVSHPHLQATPLCILNTVNKQALPLLPLFLHLFADRRPDQGKLLIWIPNPSKLPSTQPRIQSTSSVSASPMAQSATYSGVAELQCMPLLQCTLLNSHLHLII